jgi:nucleotide-binding universal stress UspA family protein
MDTYTNATSIRHILCPTDLLPSSQKTLGFAAKVAKSLGAQLTACHCTSPQWFSTEISNAKGSVESIKQRMASAIASVTDNGEPLNCRCTVIEKSFDPARSILNLAAETEVDLMIMKARPGVVSAFRFGSIVERVVASSRCPVLLLPSRFLTQNDPDTFSPGFRKVLFDYDFSPATDELLDVARALSGGVSANLRLLTVLEPPLNGTLEFATVGPQLQTLGSAMLGKLDGVVTRERTPDIGTSVQWGAHAETVLRYSRENNVDLICTTLSPRQNYFEKLYCAYLGKLLKFSECPILVKQAV